jgi:hypothetical protein
MRYRVSGLQPKPLDEGWFVQAYKRADEHLANMDPSLMGPAARILTGNQLCAHCNQLPDEHLTIGPVTMICTTYEPGEV